MQTSVKERLKLFIAHKGIGQKKFANSCGLSDGFVNNIVNSIQPKTIDRITMQYPELNPAWLLTGEGEMLRGVIDAKPMGTAVSINELAIELPYIPVAATASFVDTFYDYPDNYTPETYPVIARNGERLSAEEYAVFEVEGESMLPSLRPGSLILAKRIPEQKWDHDTAGVVVVVYGKSIVIKRVKDNRLFGTNTLTLTSDNPHFGDLPLTRPEIRAIYRAKRIISSDIL